MCCWVKHGEDWEPSACSQRSLVQEAFGLLGRALSSRPVKVLVVGVTAAALALGAYGTVLLEVRFMYVEFLPSSSSVYQWFKWDEQYFPSKGELGSVYFAEAPFRE